MVTRYLSLEFSGSDFVSESDGLSFSLSFTLPLFTCFLEDDKSIALIH